MERTGQSDVTEQNVQMGFFDFDIKPDKEVDKDRNGVTFG
jgi:hypothetical protein